METETTGLLGSNAEGMAKGRADDRNAKSEFLLLSFCFAGVRSSSMIGLFYASSIFSITLGSYSLSAYYWWFSLTCLLISAPMVEWMGSLNAIVLSQVTMTMYLLSYAVGALGVVADNETAQWTIVILGSCIGGFSSGLGWTAQGVYFSLSAKQHAKEVGVSASEANDTFAGYWASIYFGGQCALYVVASLLFEFTGFDYVDCFFTLASGATLATMLTYLWTVAPQGEDELVSHGSTWQQATATMRLTFLDPTAILLQPLNIAYGFALVFVQIIVSQKAVDNHLGTFAVG